MKLLFVYEHKKHEWWLDGLSAAITLLEKDFEITKLNLFDRPSSLDNDYDFILGWGAFGSTVDRFLQDKRMQSYKKGLCVAGNSMDTTNTNTYKVLFCETDYIKDVYLRGVTTDKVKAFGVNTDIYFKPDYPTPVIWDYIGVGSFATWKRWEKMKDKKGTRLVIGEYQLGNEDESLSIVRDLLMSGIMVSDMVSPFDLSNYYQWSRTLYIPADLNGGGERAILEARSCGLRVEVEVDNPKLKELIEIPIPTHLDYYKQLKDGIEAHI